MESRMCNESHDSILSRGFWFGMAFGICLGIIATFTTVIIVL